MNSRVQYYTNFMLWISTICFLIGQWFTSSPNSNELRIGFNQLGKRFDSSRIPTKKIIGALCEAHNLSAGVCCSKDTKFRQSVRSWFNCLLHRTTRTDERNRKGPSNHFRNWLKYHPPVYKMSSLYYCSNTQRASSKAKECPISTEKRERGYRLLRYWMALAQKHNIVWWINYGTLLGAIRDGDFIPYDHDVDVIILDAYEPVLQSLSTRRWNIKKDKINIITRDRPYCEWNRGLRMNCEGIFRMTHWDRCTMCTPFARIMTGNEGFMDVFVVRFGTPNDAIANNISTTQIGLQDVYEEVGTYQTVSYPLSAVFPLSTCFFMGLKVPCPRDAKTILEHSYGKNYRIPNKLCNGSSGLWIGD